jgi:hypothetical protein
MLDLAATTLVAEPKRQNNNVLNSYIDHIIGFLPFGGSGGRDNRGQRCRSIAAMASKIDNCDCGRASIGISPMTVIFTDRRDSHVGVAK